MKSVSFNSKLDIILSLKTLGGNKYTLLLNPENLALNTNFNEINKINLLHLIIKIILAINKKLPQITSRNLSKSNNTSLYLNIFPSILIKLVTD